MAEYIFYTAEGFTQDPKGDDVDNCQLIGIASGDNVNDAKNNLLKENPWIEERGFDKQALVGKQLASHENADKGRLS